MSVVLKTENLSKLYRLGVMSSKTLTQDINRWWARVRSKEDPYIKIGRTNILSDKNGSDYVWALKDINFEINKGEVVGIIGLNGAGKSTLLKVISRITSPTSGSIMLRGKISSLLEIGTGFHQDLTGRENTFLNGSILGMSREEIKRKFDEIVYFSGIEKYIDTPVKRYSSGMFVRLAFAVAAHLDSQILMIDEVLSVGDIEFQKRCFSKMYDVSKNEGRTVLFVSHQMGVISQMCEKSILLDKGGIEKTGNTKEVIDYYMKSISKPKERLSNKFVFTEKSEMFVKDVLTVNTNGEFTETFPHTSPINFVITLQVNELIAGTRLTLFVKDKFDRKVFTTDFRLDSLIEKNNIFETNVEIPGNFLKPGEYSADVALHIPNMMFIDLIDNACLFTIIDIGSEYSIYKDADMGCVFVDSKWTINKVNK